MGTEGPDRAVLGEDVVEVLGAAVTVYDDLFVVSVCCFHELLFDRRPDLLGIEVELGVDDAHVDVPPVLAGQMADFFAEGGTGDHDRVCGALRSRFLHCGGGRVRHDAAPAF